MLNQGITRNALPLPTFYEIAQNVKPNVLALLWVKLDADHVVAPHDARERATVIGNS